jgi:pimeloyl-ACP methyl ester carboxylesterase
MANAVLEAMQRFSDAHGKDLTVQGTRWRYYALGQGPAVVWMTGGLRRAAFGFAFLELLAHRYSIVAPDYPPLMTFDAMAAGFNAILEAEGIERFALGGQSYGGLLAQGYLVRRLEAVDRLLLSSTGPADYGPVWAFVDDLAVALVRLLPERRVKRVLLQEDLSRADVVSHFAVVADLIRSRRVTPQALAAWPGRVVVLTAENDATQSPKDIPRYAALFGRQPEVLSLGSMGHTAALQDPEAYTAILERALA